MARRRSRDYVQLPPATAHEKLSSCISRAITVHDLIARGFQGRASFVAYGTPEHRIPRLTTTPKQVRGKVILAVSCVEDGSWCGVLFKEPRVGCSYVLGDPRHLLPPHLWGTRR